MTPKSSIAITGIGGYIGTHLGRTLTSRGFSVLGLSKSGGAPATVASQSLQFNLETPLTPDAFKRVHTLIHCAHDSSIANSEERLKKNVEGTRLLFKSAKESGVSRIILISSIYANPKAITKFCQEKFALEEVAREYGAWVVRAGVLYGGTGDILIKSLKATVDALPIIFLPGLGNQKLHTLHIEDLVECLEAVITRVGPPPSSPLIAASREPVRLKDLLVKLKNETGKKRLFIPLPYPFFILGLKLFELVRLPVPMRSALLQILTSSHKEVTKEITNSPEELQVPLRAFDKAA